MRIEGRLTAGHVPAAVLVTFVVGILVGGVLGAATSPIHSGHDLPSGTPAGQPGFAAVEGVTFVPSSLPDSPGSVSQAPGAKLPSASPSAATKVPALTVTPTLRLTPGPTASPASRPTPANATPWPTPAPTATQKPTPRPTPAPATGWVTVVNDQFNAGGLPSHWTAYDGPYGSSPGCATPSHATVSGGYLHLLLGYESTGSCGAGWYSGGVSLSGFSSVDQQVTVRFRVVRTGVAGHFIIPMRWPDNDASWPAGGEEDYCETDVTSGCDTYLHYSSSDRQVAASHTVVLSAWHVIRTERLNDVVRFYVDNMATPAWTYTGTVTTLPDTLKHVVLQQECQSSCPGGTTGTEDIQIDWITVANPG